MLITFTTDVSTLDIYLNGFNATYSVYCIFFFINNYNPVFVELYLPCYQITSGTSSPSPATSTPLTSTTSVDGSTKSTLSTDPDFSRPTTSGPILDSILEVENLLNTWLQQLTNDRLSGHFGR